MYLERYDEAQGLSTLMNPYGLDEHKCCITCIIPVCQPSISVSRRRGPSYQYID